MVLVRRLAEDPRAGWSVMSADLLEQLNRAFGSKSGGTPIFTAEAEGDDYLFGPPPTGSGDPS